MLIKIVFLSIFLFTLVIVYILVLRAHNVQQLNKLANSVPEFLSNN